MRSVFDWLYYEIAQTLKEFREMLEIELVPNLSCCIECTAKKEYQESIRQYLQVGGDEELGEKIELLRAFLESADFRELRSESEKHLLVGKSVKFTLYQEQGKPRCRMKVEDQAP